MSEPRGTTPRLSIRGLSKSYASPVLAGIDLDLQPGEVHALMGANGAGKSTLARIVSGLTRPDLGNLRLDGRPFEPGSKAQAEAAGVQIVLQELNVIPTLSVAENLFLSRLPGRFGIVRRTTLRRQAGEALARFGLAGLDPDTPASRLGIGEQQLLEIAGTLLRPCRVLLLDEPTAALTDPQIDLLFRHIRRLRDDGAAIVYVSHRLEEIQRIADRTSVLRDGKLVVTRPAAQLAPDEAVRYMIGADITRQELHPARQPGPIALQVERLSRGSRVRDISFTVRQGEILGLAGLVGAGRTELLRAIYGADRADSGSLRVGDSGPARRFRQPRQAVKAGLSLVPEDRKAEGLLLAQPVRVNTSLASLRRYVRTLGRLDRVAERRDTVARAQALEVKARSTEQPVAELSGGNQQKVVLARWLLRDPAVLLLDEPTRGIDVAAKYTIYRLIDDLAAQGKAIVLVTSDLEELMSLSDRIAVLSAGKLVKTFERGQWTHESILAAAFQEHLGTAPTARAQDEDAAP